MCFAWIVDQSRRPCGEKNVCCEVGQFVAQIKQHHSCVEYIFPINAFTNMLLERCACSICSKHTVYGLISLEVAFYIIVTDCLLHAQLVFFGLSILFSIRTLMFIH